MGTLFSSLGVLAVPQKIVVEVSRLPEGKGGGGELEEGKGGHI